MFGASRENYIYPIFFQMLYNVNSDFTCLEAWNRNYLLQGREKYEREKNNLEEETSVSHDVNLLICMCGTDVGTGSQEEKGEVEL